MNLIFTCGGTAGHINPAIAVANAMREKYPDCKILFIGAEGHMEEKLVPQAGYEVRCLPGSGLSRKLNAAGLKQNLHAVKCVLGAVGECKRIFRDFQPDAVIGTGGYASFPALYAAQSMKIPTCVHESNAVPGVTTKMAASRATRVLVAFEESVKHYKHPEKVEVVGMPVRKEFLFTTKEQARKALGVTEPLVVSAFGSQGAKVMNETIADMMVLEQADGFPFHHIREYIYDMPTVLTAADVVIGRAGSATCNEIAASGTPCILVPSPNVTNNHQEKNARVLESGGGAVVLLEKDCTAETLYGLIRQLLADETRRAQMSRKLHAQLRPDSTDRICAIVEEIIGR